MAAEGIDLGNMFGKDRGIREIWEKFGKSLVKVWEMWGALLNVQTHKATVKGIFVKTEIRTPYLGEQTSTNYVRVVPGF